MQTRVLHLLRSDRFSGAENVVCQIISMCMGKNGVDMVYCSPDGEIQKALADRNIPFLPLGDFSSASLKRAIEEYRPTVIHAHDGAASVLAAATVKNIKIISHIHGNHENMRKFSLKSLLYRFYSRRFAHIFWVSDSAKNDYLFAGSVEKKSSILYNVIRLDSLRAAAAGEGEKFDVLFLGRLSYPKNPLRLLKVFSLILEKCPDATLGIVGDGALREDVEKAILEMGLSQNVTLLGFLKNPQPVLKNATLMLMTSRYEGIPMCGLEAMGLGVPTVSTPTDGLSILVDHAQNGFLSSDDEELASFAATLIGDRQLREEFSKRCLEKAETWNDETAYAEKILQRYF